MPEIIILAMIFLFVAFRLWSVLGRRTGHEQTIGNPAEPLARPSPLGIPDKEAPLHAATAVDPSIDPGALAGLRTIAESDRSFDPVRFVEGAKAAYRMILEAYWRGDEAELGRLVDGEVRDAFTHAIAERSTAGHVLDNRLVTIERAVIDQARLSGQMALITVRFDADIAAVTRDRDGTVIAGSLTDAVPTHDVWTFSRHVGAADPNWTLIETDEAA